MEFKEIQKQIIKDFNKCIGKRLKNLRKLKNYSKENFADKLSISVDELEIYESGQTYIPFPLLLLITEFLNISLDDFFGTGSELKNRKVRTNFMKVLFSLKKEIK
ncbi:helix-turn-helix transcriptional regulator [bacterium]|nr:helix-turn-helix transcriptional regulator [bacterium]